MVNPNMMVAAIESRNYALGLKILPNRKQGVPKMSWVSASGRMQGIRSI
jgi:hypothetical protein